MNLLKSLLKIILLVAIGVLCVWTGIFVASRIFKKGVVAPTKQDIAAQEASRRVELVNTMKKIAETDADFDGLSDDEEKNVYRTDPNNADSDGDGLFDGQEVTTYKTDPLKKDTYGIGHSDGWGVIHNKILPDGKVKK